MAPPTRTCHHVCHWGSMNRGVCSTIEYSNLRVHLSSEQQGNSRAGLTVEDWKLHWFVHTCRACTRRTAQHFKCVLWHLLHVWGGSLVQVLYIDLSGSHREPCVFRRIFSPRKKENNSEHDIVYIWIKTFQRVSKGANVYYLKCLKQLQCCIKGHVFIYSVSIWLFLHIWDNKRMYCRPGVCLFLPSQARCERAYQLRPLSTVKQLCLRLRQAVHHATDDLSDLWLSWFISPALIQGAEITAPEGPGNGLRSRKNQHAPKPQYFTHS